MYEHEGRAGRAIFQRESRSAGSGCIRQEGTAVAGSGPAGRVGICQLCPLPWEFGAARVCQRLWREKDLQGLLCLVELYSRPITWSSLPMPSLRISASR